MFTYKKNKKHNKKIIVVISTDSKNQNRVVTIMGNET